MVKCQILFTNFVHFFRHLISLSLFFVFLVLLKNPSRDGNSALASRNECGGMSEQRTVDVALLKCTC